MRLLKKTIVACAIALSAFAAQANASAILRTDINGGFGELAMLPNDDGSSNELSMPFDINFYGQSFDRFYVNNNGNITFGATLSEFTPFTFANISSPIIAPYWADVDTRCDGCGNVYVGSFAPGQMSVTWDNVGYYAENASKLNSFQVTLFQVGDSGDFDIEFRYNRLEWTTGDASDGIDGLGGIPAAAGYSNADGVALLQPGSFLSPGALNMAVESNVDDPGIWVYNIRNSDVPPPPLGSTPDNPILPTGQAGDDGYEFAFNVDLIGQRIFIDPPVATGYDFTATGAAFTTALFTSPLTDADGYELYDGANFLGTVAIGDVFTFATPLNSFQLRGINPANLLAPGDPLAFVSGFTFDGVGIVSVTQIPFIENYNPAAPVPEPATWAMMILGFAFVGAGLRARRNAAIRFA